MINNVFVIEETFLASRPWSGLGRLGRSRPADFSLYWRQSRSSLAFIISPHNTGRHQAPGIHHNNHHHMDRASNTDILYYFTFKNTNKEYISGLL